MDKCTELTRNRKATSAHVESLGTLDDLGIVSCFKVDSVIYDCGERADFWYQIVSGAARKCVFTLDGERQIVDFLTEGDLFGFDSREIHHFRVETIVSGARIARFPRRAAEQMADSDARLARRLRELAFESVSRIQRRMLILSRATALEKVSGFLLEMADRGTMRDLAVTLPMSRNDIADYLAMAVETVCRALKQLREHSLIRTGGVRQVYICDRDALARAAAGSIGGVRNDGVRTHSSSVGSG